MLVAAGDICQVAPTNCSGTASLVEASAPHVAVTLGDNQYSSGTLAQYLASYDLQWGRFKDKTRPSPGNHEWKTANAQGYKDYFGQAFLTNGGTWYSFDLGAWHVVSLDSQCLSIGGCGPGTPVHSWLQQDLAADDHACTLALAQAEVLLGGQPREQHVQPALLGPPRPRGCGDRAERARAQLRAVRSADAARGRVGHRRPPVRRRHRRELLLSVRSLRSPTPRFASLTRVASSS